MKIIKIIILILAVLLIGNLIFKATNDGNYMIAGAISIPFILIAFLINSFRGSVKSFKIDLDDKNLTVNQKDGSVGPNE